MWLHEHGHGHHGLRRPRRVRQAGLRERATMSKKTKKCSHTQREGAEAVLLSLKEDTSRPPTACRSDR